MSIARALTLGVLCACCAAAPAYAFTETFGENTTDNNTGVTDDTGMTNAAVHNNFGTTTSLHLHDAPFFASRSIIRIDISRIPTTATVTSATISVYEEFGITKTFGIHEILSGNDNWWPEGTKDNAAAAAGEPDWNDKEHGSTTWAGTAGLGTSGTDFNATAEDTITLSAGAGYETWDITSLAQTWVTTPSTNRGLLWVRTVTLTNTTYTSSEGTDGQRPFISVTWTEPGGGGGGGTLRTIQTGSALRTTQTDNALRTIQVDG